MQQTFERLWREDDGVLSFEWVLLLSLLAIGIVGGLTAARDALNDELGDIRKLHDDTIGRVEPFVEKIECQICRTPVDIAISKLAIAIDKCNPITIPCEGRRESVGERAILPIAFRAIARRKLRRETNHSL